MNEKERSEFEVSLVEREREVRLCDFDVQSKVDENPVRIKFRVAEGTKRKSETIQIN
jgi:predicted nucleotidyltransferase